MLVYKLYIDESPTDDVYKIPLGPFLDDTDGKTPETGLAASLTVQVCKIWNAGADNPVWASRVSTTTPTHSATAPGWYDVLFNKSEFTLGSHIIYATATGALPVWQYITVKYPDVVNSGFGEGDPIVNIADFNGDVLAIYNLMPLLDDTNFVTNLLNFFTATGYSAANSSVGGVSGSVNVTQIAASATAAANLKKFFDGTGYNAAASAVGSVGSVTGAAAANITQINGSGTRLSKLSGLLDGIVLGTAVAGTLSTTEMTTNLTETTNNHWKPPHVVKWVTGTLAGQARAVTGYAGATKKLQYAETTEPPAAGDQFVIL